LVLLTLNKARCGRFKDLKILYFMNIDQLSNKLITFLKEVKLELKKVNWPTRQETVKYTLIVIGVSVGLAIFLGGLDFVFATILNRLVL